MSMFTEALEIFQDQEAYFRKINETDKPGKIIKSQTLIIFAFTFAYGVVMGSYHSLLQSVSAGVKLFLLFAVALLICFPSFFIVQLILGSKIKLDRMLIIIMSGLLFTSAIMLAFAPIIVFFQLTGDNYHFLQLLHVGIFVFSGFFGMRLVVEALKYACEEANIYPKIGVTIFRVWVVILAFVGIQLAWNMRPFLGNEGMPFELFRSSTKGNFYATMLHAVGQMMGVDQNQQKKDKKPGALNHAPAGSSTQNLKAGTLNPEYPVQSISS